MTLNFLLTLALIFVSGLGCSFELKAAGLLQKKIYVLFALKEANSSSPPASRNQSYMLSQRVKIMSKLRRFEGSVFSGIQFVDVREASLLDLWKVAHDKDSLGYIWIGHGRAHRLTSGTTQGNAEEKTDQLFDAIPDVNGQDARDLLTLLRGKHPQSYHAIVTCGSRKIMSHLPKSEKTFLVDDDKTYYSKFLPQLHDHLRAYLAANNEVMDGPHKDSFLSKSLVSKNNQKLLRIQRVPTLNPTPVQVFVGSQLKGIVLDSETLELVLNDEDVNPDKLQVRIAALKTESKKINLGLWRIGFHESFHLTDGPFLKWTLFRNQRTGMAMGTTQNIYNAQLPD